MLRIDHALRSDRVLKALTGLSIVEFIDLTDRFAGVLAAHQAAVARQPRQRSAGAGRTPRLTTVEDKLFFILFYVKCYPTFDVAGVLFEVHRCQPHRWVHTLLPLLEQTLGEAVVLPAQKMDEVAAFFERFPQVQNLFIDGQERPTQRPGSAPAQRAYYSGKKKRHTRKNIVVRDEHRFVVFVSPTAAGHQHDYTLLKESAFLDHLPEGVYCWVDLGFQGMATAYPHVPVVIPDKKPRGGALTDEQQADNFLKASMRVVVEHAIGGLKGLNVIAHVYRNRTDALADQFMRVACGLWNYHPNWPTDTQHNTRPIQTIKLFRNNSSDLKIKRTRHLLCPRPV